MNRYKDVMPPHFFVVANLKAFFILCFTLVASVSSMYVYSQSAPELLDQIQRNHEQQLKQDELRRADELENNISTSDIFLQPKPEDKEWLQPENGECFPVEQIDLVGVTELSVGTVNSLTEPLLGECLTIARINKLIYDVGSRYLAAGFVTSRAYLKPQDIADGTLEILVVEGKLHKLVSSSGTLSERELAWSFTAKNNDIINLRDLEQGLENLNRLQSVQAKMELVPSDQQGYSDVQVAASQTKIWSGGVGVNNSGSVATGEHLANVYLSLDGLTGSNDNLYVSVSSSIDAPSGASSDSYSLSYSVPIGYNLINISASQFDYQQVVEGGVVDFTTSGSSSSQTINADRTVYRGKSDKLKVTGGITRKESENYLEDVYLDTSSRTLYLVTLGAGYTKYLESGTLSISADWTRSVDWFDAKTKVVESESDYQFDKYSVAVNYSSVVGSYNSPFRFRSDLSLFYTPDNIISSEALSLGGQYTVRGVENSSLVGFGGGYLRNEISYQAPEFLSGFPTIFIGVDLGASDTPEYENESWEFMSGAVAGLRYGSKFGSLNITYAHAIDFPDYLTVDESGIYLSIQTVF